MNLLFNMLEAAFKPSLIALTIAFGVAIMSFDSSPTRVNGSTIELTNLGCQGLMRPICGPGGLF